jgi:putative DNA primase/helicase
MPLQEFLSLDVKPRAQLLAPILPEKGLAMLYAPRGMGKTFLGLAIAYAVASGTALMRWTAPAARKVLYIDGEMPLATLQQRLANIATGATDIEQLAGRNLLILAADYFDEGLPNLATPAGQAAIEPLLEGVALIVIDNISTLASVGHDNDAESWTPVQEWLLKLRRTGYSVLLIHHAGKGGQQRGTSRREDVLDTVIALRHPSDYDPTERPWATSSRRSGRERG